VPSLKANVWIKQGKLKKAQEWADERELSVDDEISYLHEFDYVVLARLLIARYYSDHEDQSIYDAMTLLEHLQKTAEDGGRMGSVIGILLLQAIAHMAQDNIPLALVPLERALALAEPEGYVRTFVDEGTPIVQLLTVAKNTKIMPDHITKLIGIIEAEAQNVKSGQADGIRY
jgi:LuxR family maltose regulon positive regulatory protein